MGGFFGTVAQEPCIADLFYGTDYHSHLGAKRAGLTFYDSEKGFQRQIHNIENSPFRTKFDKDVNAMVGNLGMEAYNIIFTGYFPDTESFLHNILAVAVGLEFVRMLVDMTPANILEVLTVAIARHIIISHEDPLGLLVGVVCLAGIFAIRRFLIRHRDMQVELSKAE